MLLGERFEAAHECLTDRSRWHLGAAAEAHGLFPEALLQYMKLMENCCNYNIDNHALQQHRHFTGRPIRG